MQLEQSKSPAIRLRRLTTKKQVRMLNKTAFIFIQLDKKKILIGWMSAAIIRVMCPRMRQNMILACIPIC